MAVWLTFLIQISFTLLQTRSGESKLLFLQILFRHGDRSPNELYATDPNPPEVWTEGLGMLTQLGKKQHYALGKYLRSYYKDFITSNPNEVLVNSTSFDRCIRSAQTNLASLYAPDKQWVFDDSFNWQPIPVFYNPPDRDTYLTINNDCPREAEEKNKIYNSTEFDQFVQNNQIMLHYLSFYSGENVTRENVYKISDTLFIEKKYNLTIPEWADTYYEQLREFSARTFFYIYGNPMMQRLRAGPLLGDIVQNMIKKINGTIPERKLQIYSAHDINIIVVQEALKVFNMMHPPYCATMIFELHEMDSGQMAVRLLYLNSTKPHEHIDPPHVLVMEGCSEFCPLEYFMDYTRDIIPDNWERECGLLDGMPLDYDYSE